MLGSDGVFELRRAHRLPSTRLSMLPLAQLSPLQSPAQLNATGFGSMMVSPTARGVVRAEGMLVNVRSGEQLCTWF